MPEEAVGAGKVSARRSLPAASGQQGLPRPARPQALSCLLASMTSGLLAGAGRFPHQLLVVLPLLLPHRRTAEPLPPPHQVPGPCQEFGAAHPVHSPPRSKGGKGGDTVTAPIEQARKRRLGKVGRLAPKPAASKRRNKHLGLCLGHG